MNGAFRVGGEGRSRIRVLVLINAFVDDAPNRICYAIATGAYRSGDFDVVVAALAPGLPEPGIFPPEIRLVDDVAKGSVRKLFGAGKLREIIYDFRPDVFHASLTKPTLLGVPVARAAKVPVVLITHHGAHEWYARGRLVGLIVPKLYKRACLSATRTVCVSEKSSEEILALGVPEEQVAVVYNGVDEVRFSPDGRTRRHDLLSRLFPSDNPDNILLVGAAGKFEWYKGHATLIGALTRLLPEYPDVRCVIWGDGPLRSMLHEQIRAAGLEKYCVLAGHQPQMEYNLSSCDVFVQPSLREAFGLAAAEAMSCGVPAVVSDVGGLSELVGRHNTHLLFAADNDRELADRLAALLTDMDKRVQTGAAARSRVEELFTIGEMVDQYLQLYRTLYSRACETD